MDLRSVDDEFDDDEGGPWALGDDEPEWSDHGGALDDEVGEADHWLDEQLARPRPAPPDDDDERRPGDGADGADGGVVLRRPAPTRPPRRRSADPDASPDLPSVALAGYVRDRRGTWRYRATGLAVPGARDLTLRALHRFPSRRGQVLVPVEAVRSDAELAWCMAWAHTLTTMLCGGRSVTVVRVPVAEWERRADIPIGLWAPELSATRLLGITDVARIAGVTAATITAYLSRRRMPQPVTRIGTSPVWSRPVIRQWLAGRPGQGARPGH